MATKKKSLFANRQSTVSISRNGLSIEIAAVPATDAGLIAKELLDVVRTLVEGGYDELLQDGGSFHGFGHDQAEEGDDESYSLPPVMKRKKSAGFHIR